MDRRFLSLKTAPVRIHNRAEGDSEQPVIDGYAAVYYREDDPGTEYWLWDDYVERIMPGAFDNAIANDDVRALFNHNPDQLLGRSTAATLRLRSDDTGLGYEIDPPDTQIGRDVLTSIRRGDLSGSSFAFVPTKRTFREEDREIADGHTINVYIREIEEVQLFDVGPVTYPAYDSSTTGVRGRQTGIRSKEDAGEAFAALKEYRKQIAELSAKLQSFSVRARLCELNLS